MKSERERKIDREISEFNMSVMRWEEGIYDKL